MNRVGASTLTGRQAQGPSSVKMLESTITTRSSSTSPNFRILHQLPRGGQQFASSDGLGFDTAPTTPLSDYSGAAQSLFANVISPAAMLTGGLVPLGFLAPPLPGEKKSDKILRSVYMLLSVLAVSNELLAIMYATVASNKLVETLTAPAASAFALIQRDYELSWIGTNIHFLIGLCGFLGMVMIRAYTLFPIPLQKPSAALAASCLVLSLTIINRGIFEGDGCGHQLGSGTLMTFFGRYLQLIWNEVKCRRSGPIQTLSIIATFVSLGFAFRAIFLLEHDDSSTSSTEDDAPKKTMKPLFKKLRT